MPKTLILRGKDLPRYLALDMLLSLLNGDVVLKISTTKKENQIVLRIEGKLIQPWVQELESMWAVLSSRLASETLCLDLRDATYVDKDGLELLERIIESASPTVLADSPLARQFVEQASRMAERKGVKK